MSAAVAPAAAHEFGSSGWARLAAYLLLGWGIAVIAFGVLVIAQGFVRGDSDGMQYGTLGIAIGAFIGAAGGLHVLAGMYVLRHRPWARVLGIVIALLGGLLALTVLPTAFNQVYTMGVDGQLVTKGPELRSVIIGLSAVPYVLIIVGLVLGGRQVKPRS